MTEEENLEPVPRTPPARHKTLAQVRLDNNTTDFKNYC